MWALVNKDNYVIDCIIGVSFEEAKNHEVNDRFLVEMTEENSPAYLGSYYDGEKFYKPLNSEKVEKNYTEQVFLQHGLSR